MSPVLSGKGILLTTGEDEKWILPKGDRIFIAAESVNRVKWSVQPIAYGDQFNVISQIRDATNGVIRAVLAELHFHFLRTTGQREHLGSSPYSECWEPHVPSLLIASMA